MSSNLPSFSEFFVAVHGYAPFPWQVSAAERLVNRELPAVAVPTGLGKSALIDAAIWAAAHGSWRRIAYVVDRRIVVDAVHDRARHIMQRLQDPTNTRLQALATALGELQVVRLRGGVHGDDDWVLYPDRLSIVLTTVDQIGSRLLFRGYGVSPRRWPMHAGFFASDTLIIVDEAHLSEPFLQTVSILRDLGAGIDMLPMSATLTHAGPSPLKLDEDDLALPVVRRRLQASKQSSLVEIDGAENEFVKALTDLASGHLLRSGVRTVAVIVNQVRTARQCHERLVKAGLPCELLIGRSRPVARDALCDQLLPRLAASRERREHEAPLVVVATQTIEVGADFDFDALVTESASLSALRQRFGRLDRLGLLGVSIAHVVRRKGKLDPVYGESESMAWQWLQEQVDAQGGIDWGLLALQQRLKAHPPPSVPQPVAATLLPTHIEMLAQTATGCPGLDLSAWLHGPSDRAPDVALIWRDDLLIGQPQAWSRSVELLPPLLRESLAVSASAVRRWLFDQKAAELDDLETREANDRLPDGDGLPVLRWRGPDASEVISARQIRPGDTLVVPSAYGGCDMWGWAPGKKGAVDDLADEVLTEPGQPRRAVARLVAGHEPAWGPDGPALMQLVQCFRDWEEQALRCEDDVTGPLEDARQALLKFCAASSHPLLKRLGDASIEPHPNGVVLRAVGLEEVEGLIETGRAVTLDEHHADVERWTGYLAAAHPEKARLTLSASIHDAGKAELRMQALLHGDPLSALAGPVLAKSAHARRADQIEAWRASRLPRGFRHEFASLTLAPQDDALTRHLVATHHGYGRPWGPQCADPLATGADLMHLSSHWAQNWAELLEAYGPWRLAEMEWLLRAADARASMEEAAARSTPRSDAGESA